MTIKYLDDVGELDIIPVTTRTNVGAGEFVLWIWTTGTE